MSSDASRPAKRRNGVTTATAATTPAAAANGDQKPDEAERHWPLYYLPNRDIPPITPTPPSDCPLGRRRRTEIVSRQYDIASGQPVYRVRVRRCVPGEERSREAGDTNGDGGKRRMGWDGGVDGHGTNGDNAEGGRDVADDDDDAEEYSVGLADILDWVSPAELERFELEWEDDMVFITDEDGAVLLVSREVQRAMMGWPTTGGTEQTPAVPIAPHEAAVADGPPDAAEAAAVSTHTVGPGKIKKTKKKPTKEFVDGLPPVRRRGRPPKKMLKTAEVMGVVGGEDREEVEPEVGPEVELETVETGSETAEYGAWVNPANAEREIRDGEHSIISRSTKKGHAQ
ncbi:Chromo domain-containing protein [Lasiodiplodia theobromae]|uniref:Chromo domain-containing protein n=1 Tax=Lasiodiplodia theobromae TaxID=45133 RepID=UPI0015C319F8|nr:Chromo domain-containing protein [Lasiodiplodia theobromae]KAF4544287.1 Chromo domain-containing protein [Lasiodiplodia theobromae]